MAVAFAMACLVTSYEGVPQPTVISLGGSSVPTHLDRAQLENWITAHPRQATQAFLNGPGPGSIGKGPAQVPPPPCRTCAVTSPRSTPSYVSDKAGQLNPPVNEMVKIGLWIELYVGVGFIVGLGLGSLIGERTMPIIVLIALEIVVTAILAAHVMPYFLDGQRLVVGVPLDQLQRRPGRGPGRRGGARDRARCSSTARRLGDRQCPPGQ